jgi:hypothetical protein
MCHLLRICWLFLIVGAVMFIGCGHNTSQNTTPGNMPQLSSSNGPVTMTVNAPSYRASDTIIVTLSNQGSEAISFADHHTNCTVLLLQQRIDGNWKNIENCYLGRRSIWFTLNAGQHLVVKLAPPEGDWLPGLYHVTLNYRTGQASSSFSTLSSINFQVKTS